MNWLLPITVGVTTVVYVKTFNYIMRLYDDTDRTLTFSQFLNSFISSD